MKNSRLTNETETTTLIIKNMVCDRCIKVVKEEFLKLKADVRSIKLGEVVIAGSIKNLPLERIRSVLVENGFELIEDRKAKTIEQIKLVILKLVREERDANDLSMNYSDYLVNKINLDYHYLSTLFSSVENITIEQYIILQKIERAKELLKYGELTLSEIAYKLGYSSVQHLSNQFRKVTGLTASQFKSLTENTRKSLDKVELT
ncbi:MAG: helix-turn-helix domain-containing protein [Ignavibacteriaceae bacterium]